MFVLITSIIKGDRQFLIGRLKKDGGIPPEKAGLLEQASLETLVKLYTKLLFYEDNSELVNEPAVNIYFIRTFGELTQILVSITGYPDFTCFGTLDAIDYLKEQGIEVEPKYEQMLYNMFMQAAFAFESGIIKRT